MLAFNRDKGYEAHVCSHLVGPGARFALLTKNLHRHVDSM